MKLKGLYQKRDWWYYQPPMIDGQRPAPIALRTKERREAIEKYDTLVRQNHRERRRGQVTGEIKRYLAEKLARKQHSEKTSRNTADTLRLMLDFLGHSRAVADITTADLQNWVAHLSLTNNSTSINSRISTVSGFFTWAKKEGFILESPILALEIPKAVATRSEGYCTRPERDRLLQAVPADRSDLQLILHLGFFAGLRIGEIVEARVEWADIEGRVFHVRNTDTFTAKGKRARMIRMSPRLHQFLENYRASVWPTLPGSSTCRYRYLLRPDKKPGRKRKSTATQPNRWRYDPRVPFDKITDAAGLPWVGFHSMRHTFGTLHAMANTPLATIAREMGDDYKTTFNNYVGYTKHADHSGAID